MIVVAVVGILAAIAYPSYSESVLKGKRAQGRTAVAELLQQQERYMTQQNCYMPFITNTVTTVPTALASPACAITTATPVPFKTFSGDSTANAAYALSSEACSAALDLKECIRVVAVPRSNDPRVGNLSITSTGEKACTPGTNGTTPARELCWP